MLSENIYVNKEGLHISKVTDKPWIYYWTCTSCKEVHIISGDNIEDYITSDPHDPLEDYIMCPNCEHAYGLFSGVEGKCNGFKAKLYSDGTYCYLNTLGKDIRVL